MGLEYSSIQSHTTLFSYKYKIFTFYSSPFSTSPVTQHLRMRSNIHNKNKNKNPIIYNNNTKSLIISDKVYNLKNKNIQTKNQK